MIGSARNGNQDLALSLSTKAKKNAVKYADEVIVLSKGVQDYFKKTADHQMNMFEDFIGYQGSAVLDEPVQEENTAPKPPMRQKKRTTGKYSAAPFAGTICEYAAIEL